MGKRHNTKTECRSPFTACRPCCGMQKPLQDTQLHFVAQPFKNLFKKKHFFDTLKECTQSEVTAKPQRGISILWLVLKHYCEKYLMGWLAFWYSFGILLALCHSTITTKMSIDTICTIIYTGLFVKKRLKEKGWSPDETVSSQRMKMFIPCPNSERSLRDHCGATLRIKDSKNNPNCVTSLAI